MSTASSLRAPWRVHKFGGTSLANAERYQAAADLIAGSGRSAVIVSAMAGVTDALLGLVKKASARDMGYRADLGALGERVRQTQSELLKKPDAERMLEQLQRDLEDIEHILRALWLLRSPPERASDLVAGYGELWSAQLLAAYLVSRGASATWLDARQVLVVEPGRLAPFLEREASAAKLDAWLAQKNFDTVIVTGFIASDTQGLVTTLGRNGSDYSAAIFASLLSAERLDIWTDVDGVMSADPRQVSDAEKISTLSYDEAMELAYFGAKVIHPSTMTPAVEKKIPIYIRNTFAPEGEGTLISEDGGSGRTAKGFATMGDLALLNVEGSSMIGVPGIAERLFGALRDAGVSVVLISQGSSEHSICFAVPAPEAERAKAAVERAFIIERQHGQIQRVEVQPDCAVLAVVGDNMVGVPGVAAKFFGALGQAGVNIRAIAQGSSERNISAVVEGKEATRALRAVHSSFYLSDHTLSLGLIGPGLVGSTLLQQLQPLLQHLIDERRIDLRIRGIIDSKKMLLSDRPIELSAWRDRFDAQSEPADMSRFIAHIKTETIPFAAMLDCSASEEVAKRYADMMQLGLHIVTPNKKAASGPFFRYQQLQRLQRARMMHFLYETNVGAGLPVINTLRDLIQTGDRVEQIQGILSGTLAYLFNAYDGQTPFSKVVQIAKENGYTEPDPRDDLSGVDVARKMVILARELGLQVELEDVEVESLVPEVLEQGSIDDFLKNLSVVDKEMQFRLQKAHAENRVLRYIGSIDAAGKLSAKLETVPLDHPFANMLLTDNIVKFKTRRYNENPLIIRGPGAGPEVTAAGVFADLLRLASYLGASA